VIGSDKFGVITTHPTLHHTDRVFSSWNTIFVLTAIGHVTGWGNNGQGQIPSQDMPFLDTIATGCEHAVGLTRDGRVVAWGWDEHGECGKKSGAEGYHQVAEAWTELKVRLFPEQYTVGVGAGYSSTWIIVNDRPASPSK